MKNRVRTLIMAALTVRACLGETQADNDPVLHASCRNFQYRPEIIGGNLFVCVSREDRTERRYGSYAPCSIGGTRGNEMNDGTDRCIVFGRTLPAAPCPQGYSREMIVGNPDRCYRFEVVERNVVAKATDAIVGQYVPDDHVIVSKAPSSRPDVSGQRTIALRCATAWRYRTDCR